MHICFVFWGMIAKANEGLPEEKRRKKKKRAIIHFRQCFLFLFFFFVVSLIDIVFPCCLRSFFYYWDTHEKNSYISFLFFPPSLSLSPFDEEEMKYDYIHLSQENQSKQWAWDRWWWSTHFECQCSGLIAKIDCDLSIHSYLSSSIGEEWEKDFLISSSMVQTATR